MIRTVIFHLLLASTITVLANEDGRVLHNENCLRCHQPDIYIREDRLVKNLKHLRSQVQFCESSNDLFWFEEEVDAVTDYLNLEYYLFGLK